MADSKKLLQVPAPAVRCPSDGSFGSTSSSGSIAAPAAHDTQEPPKLRHRRFSLKAYRTRSKSIDAESSESTPVLSIPALTLTPATDGSTTTAASSTTAAAGRLGAPTLTVVAPQPGSFAQSPCASPSLPMPADQAGAFAPNKQAVVQVAQSPSPAGGAAASTTAQPKLARQPILTEEAQQKANEEGMIVFPIRLPRLQVNRKLDVARVQSSFRLAASELLLGKWDASLCRTLCHRGTLYLFQEHLCFQGRNHDVKEVLRLRDLVSVCVKKRYMSAIEVASKGSSDKLLFALAVAAPQDVASAVVRRWQRAISAASTSTKTTSSTSSLTSSGSSATAGIAAALSAATTTAVPAAASSSAASSSSSAPSAASAAAMSYEAEADAALAAELTRAASTDVSRFDVSNASLQCEASGMSVLRADVRQMPPVLENGAFLAGLTPTQVFRYFMSDAAVMFRFVYHCQVDEYDVRCEPWHEEAGVGRVRTLRYVKRALEGPPFMPPECRVVERQCYCLTPNCLILDSAVRHDGLPYSSQYESLSRWVFTADPDGRGSEVQVYHRCGWACECWEQAAVERFVNAVAVARVRAWYALVTDCLRDRATAERSSTADHQGGAALGRARELAARLQKLPQPPPLELEKSSKFADALGLGSALAPSLGLLLCIMCLIMVFYLLDRLFGLERYVSQLEHTFVQLQQNFQQLQQNFQQLQQFQLNNMNNNIP